MKNNYVMYANTLVPAESQINNAQKKRSLFSSILKNPSDYINQGKVFRRSMVRRKPLAILIADLSNSADIDFPAFQGTKVEKTTI